MSTPLSDGIYHIASLLDDKKVLEVMGEKANDGTPVDLWENNNKPHQQWRLKNVGEARGELFYTIGHPGTGMVMEAPGPWKAGDPIVLRNYEQGDDKTHRQWKLQAIPGKQGTYTIINRRSGLAIDVEHGDLEKGEVKLYAPWNAPDDRQRWKLVASPSSSAGMN